MSPFAPLVRGSAGCVVREVMRRSRVLSRVHRIAASSKGCRAASSEFGTGFPSIVPFFGPLWLLAVAAVAAPSRVSLAPLRRAGTVNISSAGRWPGHSGEEPSPFPHTHHTQYARGTALCRTGCFYPAGTCTLLHAGLAAPLSTGLQQHWLCTQNFEPSCVPCKRRTVHTRRMRWLWQGAAWVQLGRQAGKGGD